MPPNPFAKLRKLCLALPEAHEVEAWGEPTFRVRNKMFAMAAHANTHHGAGRHAVWVKSTSDEQQERIAAAQTSSLNLLMSGRVAGSAFGSMVMSPGMTWPNCSPMPIE